jgi:hypothetical protein
MAYFETVFKQTLKGVRKTTYVSVRVLGLRFEKPAPP